jgi:hypothetical protein
VEKQYFLIRTVSINSEIRWSICGHSRLYSESGSHVAYKCHQLFSFSQPLLRVIWLSFTPVNTSELCGLCEYCHPVLWISTGMSQTVLFNCHGKSLFINSTQYTVLLVDELTLSNFALFSRHIASVNSKR